ncbi:ribosomal protein S7 [Marasmius fiardii PR-910]|nr:ribosomal protein S7 [Marasmius fiardii PR-910]
MNIPPQEDPLLHFLASRIMNHGERAKASRTISEMLLHIHAWTRSPPLPLLRQAIFKLSPAVKVVGHKHSTKMIYKPVPLSEKQGIWWATEWILDATKGRQGGPTLAERMAREVILILKDESTTLQKKKQFHEAAMMNRGNIAIART